MKKNKFIVFFLCLVLLILALSGCKTDNTEYSAIINDITLNKMSANVKIEIYDKAIIIENIVGEGSGVIYDIKKVDNVDGADNYEYYVLTNNHVVSIEVDYTKVFYLYDYLGVKYSGELVAKNSSADLSVLKFTTKNVLSKIDFAENLPKENEPVFVVSTPKSQPNAITVGKFNGLIDAPLVDGLTSNIKFKVVKHSAQIQQGSSGSMLLDKDLRLVGINYAGIVDGETKEYLSSLAIPINRVKEFLQSVD